MFKRAVILAGGIGTRLRPYTNHTPKPMVKITKFTILEIIIKQLKFYKFNHITLTVNYKSSHIKNFFKDGSSFGVKIDYIEEVIPLGTMGSLSLIDNLPKNFLVMNGDILTNLNYEQFFNSHIKNNNFLTISSFVRKIKSDYGELEVKKNVLKSFKEKPDRYSNVSMGIYGFNVGLVKFIPKNTYYGFDDLIHTLLKKRRTINVQNFNEYWLDIGREKDYLEAIKVFTSNKEIFLNNE